jgi:hypothetical protein
MQLNQQQLEEHASRKEVRSKRRKVLETILANREDYVSNKVAKGYRISKVFILLVITAMVSSGFFAYYLSTQ